MTWKANNSKSLSQDLKRNEVITNQLNQCTTATHFAKSHKPTLGPKFGNEDFAKIYAVFNPSGDLFSYFYENFNALNKPFSMTKFKTIKELSGAVTNHIEISYPTGIMQFDRHKVKFVPGQVVLVGSRPAMGRTMFLYYLYYNLWKSNHSPQCFITNEENENQSVVLCRTLHPVRQVLIRLL
jgi:hypothetical protein